MYGFDPPPDEGHDPNRCDCGEHLSRLRDEAMRLLAADPIAQAALQAAAEGKLPPPPEALTCPLCSFEGAADGGCPACGARFYRLVSLRDREGQVVATPPLRPEVVEACKRIKRATLALADRYAGIDTRLRRPLVDSLPALQAQLASRHDLPMRVVADMLDEVVPMLELLARVRAVVDAANGGSALHWIDGFAQVRDTLYPDTEVARHLNARRAMTPAERDAERAAADAAEREAWAGIREPGDALVRRGPGELACDACGSPLAEYAGPGDERCVICPTCDAESLRED